MSIPGWPEALCRLVLALALSFGAAALQAQPAPPDAAAERSRIGSERAAAESRYRQALADCAGSFALTACQDRARSERRQAFERLDAEQAALDDRQRRERTAARRQAIEIRQADRAAASAPTAAAVERRPAGTPAPASVLPAPQARSSDAASAAARREAQALERYRERQQRAEAHQLEVQRRNAEQDARHPPAPGLPTPAASAAR